MVERPRIGAARDMSRGAMRTLATATPLAPAPCHRGRGALLFLDCGEAPDSHRPSDEATRCRGHRIGAVTPPARAAGRPPRERRTGARKAPEALVALDDRDLPEVAREELVGARARRAHGAA